MAKAAIFLCLVYALAVFCDSRQTFKQMADPAQQLPKVVNQYTRGGAMLQATKGDTLKQEAPLESEQLQATKGATLKQEAPLKGEQLQATKDATLKQEAPLKGEHLQATKAAPLEQKETLEVEQFQQEEAPLEVEQFEQIGGAQRLQQEQDFEQALIDDQLEHEQFGQYGQGQLEERGWWNGRRGRFTPENVPLLLECSRRPIPRRCYYIRRGPWGRWRRW